MSDRERESGSGGGGAKGNNGDLESGVVFAWK